jgi:hypothetical protein
MCQIILDDKKDPTTFTEISGKMNKNTRVKEERKNILAKSWRK